MKLKTLTLINFQKHSNLVLNFNDNLNVITGLTGTGKSCIFRALEWVCNLSNISMVDFRKEGTKETSVSVVLDNGFTVKRVRSTSINRYILSKEGCDDVVFNSFGKETPEEIKKVLEISSISIDNDSLNLNFASQDQLNFILDTTYSDTFKAKLFNKLTGNEALDDIFKDLNKEHLRISREVKQTEQQIEKQEEQLSECSTQYKKDKNKLNLVKTKFKSLSENIEIYEHLKDLAMHLTGNKQDTELIEIKKSQIKSISEDKLKELKEKAKLLECYQELFEELESVKSTIKSLNKQKESIGDVKVVDSDNLKQKNESLQNLIQLQSQLLQNNQQSNALSEQISDAKKTMGEKEKELKVLWDKCDVCPLCKGKTNHGK